MGVNLAQEANWQPRLNEELIDGCLQGRIRNLCQCQHAALPRYVRCQNS